MAITLASALTAARGDLYVDKKTKSPCRSQTPPGIRPSGVLCSLRSGLRLFLTPHCVCIGIWGDWFSLSTGSQASIWKDWQGNLSIGGEPPQLPENSLDHTWDLWRSRKLMMGCNMAFFITSCPDPPELCQKLSHLQSCEMWWHSLTQISVTRGKTRTSNCTWWCMGWLWCDIWARHLALIREVPRVFI